MDSNTLGKFLRSLRKSHGYTQEFVASKLNIIHQTYSHYETGRITPPSDSLYLLARLYEIPVDRLLQLTLPPSLQEDDDLPMKHSMPSDELTAFLDYMNEPVNYVKFKHLSSQEKRILFYFQQLNHKNQSKLIEMARLELKFQVPVQKS